MWTKTDEILAQMAHGCGLAEAIEASEAFKCRIEQLYQAADDFRAPWGCDCGVDFGDYVSAVNHVLSSAAAYDTAYE